VEGSETREARESEGCRRIDSSASTEARSRSSALGAAREPPARRMRKVNKACTRHRASLRHEAVRCALVMRGARQLRFMRLELRAASSHARCDRFVPSDAVPRAAISAAEFLLVAPTKRATMGEK